MFEQLDTPEMKLIGERLEVEDLQRMNFDSDLQELFNIACKVIRDNGLQDAFNKELLKKPKKA